MVTQSTLYSLCPAEETKGGLYGRRWGEGSIPGSLAMCNSAVFGCPSVLVCALRLERGFTPFGVTLSKGFLLDASLCNPVCAAPAGKGTASPV